VRGSRKPLGEVVMARKLCHASFLTDGVGGVEHLGEVKSFGGWSKSIQKRHTLIIKISQNEILRKVGNYSGFS
jgi:hypothetical protein